MDKEALIVIIVVVFLVGFLVYISLEDAQKAGFCEGKRYDGHQEIGGKWCCYRGEDGTFVAVPISVLKGK